MNVNLEKYRGKKICVAVSGGRDSMALLYYLHAHAEPFKIALCAVNCDHGIRGGVSASDSAFVKDICGEWGIPLDFYKTDCVKSAQKNGLSVETYAREWRINCYFKAITKFKAEAVATAHHMNDNAETLLFNLARGSGLAGLRGICDCKHFIKSGESFEIIRPLAECTRAQIDDYIKQNNIPYVEDETNGGNDYTRNYIRHNVIPQLEKAVPSAVKSIYRFSRLADEDEKYFNDIICARNMINLTIWGGEICFCREKPIFTRAAVTVLKLLKEDIKDYTYGHLERLYDLQTAGAGKKFEFLSFIAYSERGKISICRRDMLDLKQCNAVAFTDYTLCGRKDYFGQYIKVCNGADLQNTAEYLRNNCPTNLEKDKIKALKFDADKIPANAVVRFMQAGDKFTKFGGGTKNLGDYFTDKKIPVRFRGQIPLVASGSDILIICGVEISDKVKITAETEAVSAVICADYARL